MGADTIPLSPEDRAILDLESDTVAGHTCKVIVLGRGALGIDALRARVADRLARAPALRRRLGGGGELPTWVPDERFELRRHVVACDLAGPLAPDRLPDLVAELFAERLDRGRPLWRMDLAPASDGGAVIVWRLHHAVADGTTAMRYARLLLWDEAPTPTGSTAVAPPSAHESDDERRRGHLGAFVKREFSRSHGRSPFDGRIGTRRAIAFADTSLKALHDAAHRLADATVNDAVLTVLSEALRHWIEAEHGSLADLRVKVPVSLHHEGDDVGNRDSFFTLALPLSEPDPVARLRAVKAATAARKEANDARELDELHRELSRASPGLQLLCRKLESSPRRFALSISNVPGPRSPVSVGNTPVAGLHSLAEIGERHALRVAVISFAGTLGFGFCADPGIVGRLDALAGGVEAGATALQRAAG